MDDIVVAAKYMFPNDAEMAKLRLEAEGIECLIANAATSLLTTAPGSMGGILVQVHSADLERAVEVLKVDAAPRMTMTNPSFPISDEVPFDKRPGEAFESIKEVMGRIGKVKSVDPETLTVTGEVGGWLPKCKLKLQIKPDGNRSRLSINAQRLGSKWIDRIYEELGIVDE